MQPQRTGDVANGVPAASVDPAAQERATGGPASSWPNLAPNNVQVGQNVMTVRDRIRWGPILGGIATAVAVMLVLGSLGLAVGLSAFKPGTSATKWSTGAGIWGGLTALFAFFCGGWAAAKASAVGGTGSGLLNGFVTGAATLALIVVLAVSGVTNVLGFVGSNASAIAAVTTEAAASTGQLPQAQQQAQQTANQVQNAASNSSNQQAAYNAAKDGAWGTFVAFILLLILATIGGWVGANRREEIIRGSAAGG